MTFIYRTSLENDGVYFDIDIQAMTTLGDSPNWPLEYTERHYTLAAFGFSEFQNETGELYGGFTYFYTEKTVFLHKLFNPICKWDDFLNTNRQRPEYLYTNGFRGMIPAYYRLTQPPFNVKLWFNSIFRSGFEIYYESTEGCQISDYAGLHNYIIYCLWEQPVSVLMLFQNVYEFQRIVDIQ
jgi:hypothetical protein